MPDGVESGRMREGGEGLSTGRAVRSDAPMISCAKQGYRVSQARSPSLCDSAIRRGGRQPNRETAGSWITRGRDEADMLLPTPRWMMSITCHALAMSHARSQMI
uniref:Uncharacterized protein n=1 Tax=Haptolina brevifila TaxID=156173 RepID=A0A7S2H333_9EUKA